MVCLKNHSFGKFTSILNPLKHGMRPLGARAILTSMRGKEGREDSREKRERGGESICKREWKRVGERGKGEGKHIHNAYAYGDRDGREGKGKSNA